MKAYLSKRAARAAERIDTHWREHGDDPGAPRITNDAGLAVPEREAPSVAASLDAQVEVPIYFEIDEANQAIQILHLWDGRRERAPKL